MYKKIIRPLLFRFNAETVHNLIIRALKYSPFRHFTRLCFKRQYDSLKRNVFGITFSNPIGLAAGLDKNAECYNVLSDFGFSFIEIGSLTPKPQPGNPLPRIFRLPDDTAIINRMGINNIGIQEAINNIRKNSPETILVANIAMNSTSQNDEINKDYKMAFSLMYDFADMFTLNISCPNVEGLQSLQDISFLSDILDPILELRLCYDKYKPILLKISPDIDKIQLNEILDFCMLSGIDGIVAGNTSTKRDGLNTSYKIISEIGKGGLSGSPLFEKTKSLVSYIYNYTKGRFPIIGVGGITTPERAKQMLDAGASLIEVYTGFIYEGPSFIKKILKYLNNASK